MAKSVHLFAVIVLLSMSGCGKGTKEVAEWSEEVELHDGKIVTVQRRSTLGSNFSPGSHRGLVESWELCYLPMKAYWKSNSPFQPNHFDIANGQVYVKVPVRGCGECKVTGRPKDGTLYFVLRNGQWQPILADQYPNKSWKNLIFTRIWNARSKEGDITGHWPLETKWQRDPHTQQSAYGKTLMRSQLTACTECNYDTYSTNLKLTIESVPTDSFCKR